MDPILMDNEVVAVGDQVYDTAFGLGVVTEIRIDRRFVVLFENHRRSVYAGSGYTRELAHRTLFWRNPILIAPPRNEQRWSLVQRLLNVILQELPQ